MVKEDLLINLDDFMISLKLQEKSQATLSKYRRDIIKFVNYLEDSQTVTKEITIAYKQNLCDKKYKLSSINSFIVILNKYLKYLNHEDLCVKQMRMQRKSSLDDVLSASEYRRLLRCAKKYKQMDTYYIMKILATTGIRINELDFFTVESIKSFYIEVRNKGKSRTVYLRQDLARELRKYCRQNHIYTGIIFKICKSTIWRKIQKVAGIAKVKKDKVHPHSFRHMFSKLYLEQTGNDYMGLADILGHSSLETTRIYQVSTNAEKRERVESIKFNRKETT